MGDRPVPTLRGALVQLRRLLLLARPYWGGLGRSAAMALVLGLFALVPPLLTKLLIDLVYPTGDVSLLLALVLAGLSFSLAGALLGGLRSFYTVYVDSRLTSATRLLFFNHLQHLKPRFFHRHQVGEINSRFQDVALALRTLSDLFRTVFVQGIYLVLIPPLLLWIEWRLGLLALLSVPLATGITAWSGKVLRPHWQRTSEALADINAFQIETLSHVETFKAMGLEPKVARRGRSLIEEALEHQLRAQGLSETFSAFNTGIKALNLALFTGFGWLLILDRAMTLGDYVAFTAYVSMLYGPVAQLIRLFGQVQQSSIHLARMFEILDQEPEQDPAGAWTPDAPLTRRLRGHFDLRGVGFEYTPERPVLRQIDLEIGPGARIALVGASGSGKTTLLRLLCGLERPTAGRLRIDGEAVEDLDLRTLRRQVAVVWQDPALVRGSLWHNLTLGLDDAPPVATVDEAVTLCGLDTVVADLPRGYDTEVAEWGASLSAGQRQRVALARAVLRDTPIVLFDEATSNLDVGTEATLLERLDPWLAGRTVVLVTHRMAVARRAGWIGVLDAGRLVGQGDHSTLLERCDPYRQMLRIEEQPMETLAP